ncbi:MAG: Calx-beta domain-containing protein, partial [Myxococcota bacterium]
MDIFKGPKTRGLWPHLAVTTSLLVSCSFTPSNPPPSDMVDGGEDIGLEDTMVDAGRLDTGMNDADVDGGMPNGTCGDGIINGQPPETCDDGNTTPDDGCEANCGVITPGFQCEVVDDVPASVCERSPVLSVTSTTVREGDVALVRVQLSAPTERLTVSFMWQTVDNGTAETNDYTAVPPTMVTILPGEQEAVLAIQTMPDALREQPEAFTVQIQNAQGAISNDLMATVTIEDDRTPSENGL